MAVAAKAQVMLRYIVQPKPSAQGVRRLSLMGREVAPESREKQIREVLAIRAQDPVEREIREWVDDAQRRQVIREVAHTSVTGTTIFGATAETVETLRQELPNVEIFTDRPVDLIEPVRHPATQ